MALLIFEHNPPFTKVWWQLEPALYVRLGIRDTRYALAQEPPRFPMPAVIKPKPVRHAEHP